MMPRGPNTFPSLPWLATILVSCLFIGHEARAEWFEKAVKRESPSKLTVVSDCSIVNYLIDPNSPTAPDGQLDSELNVSFCAEMTSYMKRRFEDSKYHIGTIEIIVLPPRAGHFTTLPVSDAFSPRASLFHQESPLVLVPTVRR